MSCLFQQHFLPVFLGNDTSLLRHQSYLDYKEEFTHSRRRNRKGKGKDTKSNSTKKLFREIKKIVKTKTTPRTLFDEDKVGNEDSDNRELTGSKENLHRNADQDLEYSYPYEDGEIQDAEQGEINASLDSSEYGAEGRDRDNADWSEDEGDLYGLGTGIYANQEMMGNATLKEVQNAIAASSILTLRCGTNNKLTIILTNGTIIHVWIRNLFAHDYVYTINPLLQFDEAVSSVAYGQTHVLFLFPDNRLVVARKQTSESHDGINEDGLASAAVGNRQKPGRGQGHKRGGVAEAQTRNMSKNMVQVSTYKQFLPPLSAKKPNKRVVLSDTSQLFMIWWPNCKDEIFASWTPNPEEKANILIYSLAGYEPELQFFAKTEHTLLDTYFIDRKDEAIEVLAVETYGSEGTGQLLVVETAYQVKGGSSNKYRNEITFPVHSAITCHNYSKSYTHLGIGCSNRTIGVHLREGQITRTTKCSFAPTAVSWHPQSCLLIVFGDQGQFQVYDIALTPILLCPVNSSPNAPSMTQQLVPAAPIQKLIWAPFHANSDSKQRSSCYLMMQFQSEDLGVGLLRFTLGSFKLPNLVKFYLADAHISNAIKLLKSVQWNSDQCLHSMYSIFGALITKHHSEDVEAQLEELLSTFFVPLHPPDEFYRKKSMPSVCVLAKKFFMWMLRAGRLERALQIAVSLKDGKLLRHIKKVAETLNNQQLLRHPDLKNVCSSQGSDEESSKTDDDESSDSYSDADADHSFSSSYSCPHAEGESCTCSEWEDSSSSYSSCTTSTDHGSKSSKYSGEASAPSVDFRRFYQSKQSHFPYQSGGIGHRVNQNQDHRTPHNLQVDPHADGVDDNGRIEMRNQESIPANNNSSSNSSRKIVVVHLGSV